VPRGIEYAPCQLYVHVQGSLGEIHNPTQWNLIDRGMKAPPPVLSPSIILPQPSSHCTFIPVMEIFDVLFRRVQFFLPF